MPRHDDEEILEGLNLDTLSVDYLQHKVGPEQRKRVDVRMHQMRAEDGQLHVQQMDCPLGHAQKFFEEGLKLLRMAGQGPREPHWDSPDKVVELKGYKASYFINSGKDGKNRIDVHLEHEERDNAELRKSEMSCSLDRLGKVVQEGCRVEQERGIKREYYAIVGSPEFTGPGELRAAVHSCCTDQKQGLINAFNLSDHSRKPQDYVLWPEPLGWEPSQGDKITVSGGVDKELDKHIAKRQADAERIGQVHAYGVWHDKDRQPTVGEPISWNSDRGGVNSNGEVVDYLVTPATGNRKDATPEKTTYVVFNRETRKIVSLCDRREEASQAVKDWDRFELEVQREQQQGRQRQNTQTIDLSQEHFGPRR